MEKEVKPKSRISNVAEFIRKAMTCKYNHLWICEHPKQDGIKCEKVCEYYKHGKDN